jgi:twitching motility protein PilT
MPYANPIDPFLEAVVACDGSDLHLVPGGLPRVRSHGRMAPVRRDEEHHIRELTADELRVLILGTMPQHLHRRWESQRDVDYSYDAGAELGRFRVAAYHEQRGPAVVFRRVPLAPAALDEIGLPAPLRQVVDLSSGLVLFVGPTGAGKSTTMAAVVNEVNERRAGKILTIEDPVEFSYREKGCVISQREVGSDARSFASAARAGLRQDPDVIVIGEIRTRAVLTQVLTMAETGHLVFSTIHAKSSAGGLARVLGLVESTREEATRRQFAGVIRAVVAQRLVARADGAGRIAAFEVLLATSATMTKLRDGHIGSLRSDLNDRSSGMITLERSLAELVIRGEVHEDDAFAQANELDQLRGELRAARGC